MAGQDKFVYLVHDADSNFSISAHRLALLKATPLTQPFCDVWRVHQLEPHWYSVTMYTNMDWNGCWAP